MKSLCFTLTFFALLSCGAWQIDSSYKIVIPEKPVDKTVFRCLKEAAEVLQSALAKGGIKVKIKTASEAVPGNKSIFLGFPDGKKHTKFDGALRIEKRDVYITGNDYPGMFKPGPRNSPHIYYLGTYTALAFFMQEYLDCKFLLPCKEAIFPVRMPSLPEKLDMTVKAPLEFASGTPAPLRLYEYATANFGRGGTHVYGGHSHDKAIPQSKYGKSNPEYFSFAKGKRYSNIHYHGHCLSNPAVEELIYRNLLERLDKGAEMAELGQSDGNIPCECKSCLAMPGGKDPGERLWLFHLKLAKRLEKDRPGKKALIICYWPNLDPPKNTRKFPANVTVELTRYEKEYLDKWRNYQVPGGFYVYIYNWGFYQAEGFTPKNCDPGFLEEQVRLFQKMGIKGLYRCGYRDLSGLEGPAYYIYGQLWHRPEATGEELFREYCSRVFGKAAPEMTAFYRLLYSRQKYSILPGGETRWSHLWRAKGKVGELPLNQGHLVRRYPPQIIAQLKALLAKASPKMTTPAAKWIKPYIEKEFRYLECTAQIANCMDQLRSKNDRAAGEKLLCFIAGRNKAVKDLTKLPELKNRFATMQAGGSMYAILTFPYHIDAEYLLANKIPLCSRTIKADGKPQLLIKDKGHSHPVTVSVTADEKNLKVRFTYPLYKRSELGEDKLNFYIEDSSGKLCKFQVWLTPTRIFASHILKSSTANGGEMEVRKPFDPKGAGFTFKDNAQQQAEAEFSIPFALLGGRIAPGTKRKFNASCLRYRPGNNKKQEGFAIWEPNMGKMNWKQEMDRQGTLEF